MTDRQKKLDGTISNICDWIDEELKDTDGLMKGSILPETISALAELVTARAKYEYES
ncbi:MAG: hypothetical protein II992_12750 [Lachnospiraceae bacterium]|nr:hypothetical protein [Lachnospiraceae bacterium]